MDFLSECRTCSAFPIGPALALRLDGGMLQPAHFFNVLQNFHDGIDDAVDIFLAAEKQMMREPYRLVIRGALGSRTLVHVAEVERLRAPPTESREVRRVKREEGTAIHRLVKKT